MNIESTETGPITLLERERALLADQFQYYLKVAGTVAAVWSAFLIAILAYMGYSTHKDLEASLAAKVDDAAINYKLVDVLREKMQIRMDSVVEDAVRGERVGKLIEAEVSKSAVQHAKSAVSNEVAGLVKRSIDDLKRRDLKETVERLTLPQGAVLGFNQARCPNGWKPFEAGPGRTLVGAGRGQRLSIRDVGQQGGGEYLVLSYGNLPPHSHITSVALGPDPFLTGGSGVGAAWSGGQLTTESRANTSSTGNGEPLSNMPPYVVVLFCEKT